MLLNYFIAEEERATVITKHEAEKSVLSTETATNNPQQDGVFKRPCEPTSESPQKRPRYVALELALWHDLIFL